MIIVSRYFFFKELQFFARTNLLIIVTVNNIARIIWEIKDEIYINITVFIMQLPDVWTKNLWGEGVGVIYSFIGTVTISYILYGEYSADL